MSDKGQEYARALPKLIHDNIDHAQLTVGVLSVHNFTFVISILSGMDFDSSTNHRDGSIPGLPEVDLESFGRA